MKLVKGENSSEFSTNLLTNLNYNRKFTEFGSMEDKLLAFIFSLLGVINIIYKWVILYV